MTVLLLHGLGSDRKYMLDVFGPVLATLAPGERVIAPDARAHGASPLIGTPADFALDRLAAEVEASVAAQTAVSVDSGDAESTRTAESAVGAGITVVGVSMGAALALRMALAGRIRIDRALFVRPSFTDRSMPENLRAFPVIGQLLHDVGPVEGQVLFRETPAYRSAVDASPLGGAGLLAQFRYPLAVERAVRLVEVPRNRAFDSETELASLGARMPTAVIGAPRDPVHPFPAAEQWAGALGSPLTRLPARDDGQPAQLAVLRAAFGEWLRA
ncbi:alpha/beta hydrolase [Leifsonia sp. YIM 134122]|uniref:Alpha/beta hydrolase n=1 Tax=Leifsonia stereocauli TaxID=3134136 RepID=A0ABU9W879_9MICO